MACVFEEIEQVIEERISQGIYRPGEKLPAVRVLAEELHVSPSTVSRAIQHLADRGVVRTFEKRGVVVASAKAKAVSTDGVLSIKSAIKNIAIQWRMRGGKAEELSRIFDQALNEVFASDHPVYFVECSPDDLTEMAGQVMSVIGTEVKPILLDDLKDVVDTLVDGTIFTPYFHLADVRSLHPKCEVVALNFQPSEEIVASLATVPEDCLMGVVGTHGRSLRRLKGIAQQFCAARLVCATITETERIRAIVDSCDVVFTTRASILAQPLLNDAKRVIVCHFVLESQILPKGGGFGVMKKASSKNV